MKKKKYYVSLTKKQYLQNNSIQYIAQTAGLFTTIYVAARVIAPKLDASPAFLWGAVAAVVTLSASLMVGKIKKHLAEYRSDQPVVLSREEAYCAIMCSGSRAYRLKTGIILAAESFIRGAVYDIPANVYLGVRHEVLAFRDAAHYAGRKAAYYAARVKDILKTPALQRVRSSSTLNY